jgi:hypothetical protein
VVLFSTKKFGKKAASKIILPRPHNQNHFQNLRFCKFLKNFELFEIHIYKFRGFGFFKQNFTAVDHFKCTSLCTLASCPSGDAISTYNLITSPLVTFLMTPPGTAEGIPVSPALITRVVS